MTLEQISEGMKTETGSKVRALGHSAVGGWGGEGRGEEEPEGPEKPGMRRYNKDITGPLVLMR